jgi:hypothetical protein
LGSLTNTELRLLRIDLAQRSKWNIGYFCGGLVFWLYVAFTAMVLPPAVAKVYWLVGTFLIFPLAIAFSRICRADPFCRGNDLGELVGYTHMSVIAMTFPIVIAAFIYLPEALLLFMAISYCLDFYVMSWAFGSRLFGLHATLRTVAVTVIWFALPEWRTSVLPVVVATAYLTTVVLIPPLRRQWLKENRATTFQAGVIGSDCLTNSPHRSVR